MNRLISHLLPSLLPRPQQQLPVARQPLQRLRLHPRLQEPQQTLHRERDAILDLAARQPHQILHEEPSNHPPRQIELAQLRLHAILPRQRGKPLGRGGPHQPQHLSQESLRVLVAAGDEEGGETETEEEALLHDVGEKRLLGEPALVDALRGAEEQCKISHRGDHFQREFGRGDEGAHEGRQLLGGLGGLGKGAGRGDL